MMYQKRGLVNRVSCPTMLGVKLLTPAPVEPRWAKQQIRSSGPKQQQWIALCRGHHSLIETNISKFLEFELCIECSVM